MVHIYTDGACIGNPGPGGWAAIIVEDGRKRVLHGREKRTTNNRMEITAAIKGLEAVPEGSSVTVVSDSEYLVKTMTLGWKRNANRDLWAQLDDLASRRQVQWQWVQGHAGHPENEEADRLANWEANGGKGHPPTARLSHLDERGAARQVDVGGKPVTRREAVAKGSVLMRPETLRLIQSGGVPKGDVFAVARVAGVMGAKRTPDLVPLCHPMALDGVTIDLEPDEARSAVHITATARATARTGVEMEALTAVTAAALAIYDMCKAVDRRMRIQDVRLVRKSGGKSGEIVLEE